MNEDPMSYYVPYSAWLMNHREVFGIYNGDDLIRCFEDAEGFEEFLAERKTDVPAER